MSDLPVARDRISPWLSVEMDHRFRNNGANFHLHVDFKSHAFRTVIFGPSGSGKSSLLRAIAGLFTPDMGSIELHGNKVWQKINSSSKEYSIPAEKRRAGLVMQNPAVFPHLTVARNVAFTLRGLENSARQERVSQLLQRVEAEELAFRWPRELSGGQLQRVAIARTLAAEPSILLLDEPFGALDAESRQRLSENVHVWARERSVPVLTVTHNLEEAFAAGDEVLTMRDGCITGQGTPSEVLAEERDRLLRAMGAALPVNR